MSRAKERLFVIIGTCGGLGYAPIMPATFAALVGVAIFYGTRVWVPENLQTAVLLISLVAFSAANNLLSDWAESYWDKKDPGEFVLDEVAGYLMTVLLFRGGPDLISTLIWTFLATRILDIIKIPPARQLERIGGGWGILLDDLASSVYAALLLHAVRYFYPTVFG